MQVLMKLIEMLPADSEFIASLTKVRLCFKDCPSFVCTLVRQRINID